MPRSFQEHLDSVFGEQSIRKIEPAPDEELLARERAFREQTKKIEELRQRRVSSEEQLPTLVYDVVRHRGHWRILHLKKHSAPFADQAAAISAAAKLAKKKSEQGRTVEVRLQRTDGQIVTQPLDEEPS